MIYFLEEIVVDAKECEFPPEDVFSSDDCSGIADVSVVSGKGSFTSQKDSYNEGTGGSN